jgi:hypothetical protein
MDIREQIGLVEPEAAQPLDVVEFSFNANLFLERLRNLKVSETDDREKWMVLGVIMLSAERYPNDKAKYWSFNWRWNALIGLIGSGALDSFVRRGPRPGEFEWIHEAVFEVAARLPLPRQAQFEAPTFLAELKKSMV